MAIQKMKWESPQLFQLGGSKQTVHGSCDYGQVPTQCSPTGSADIWECFDGNFAAVCQSVGTQADVEI